MRLFLYSVFIVSILTIRSTDSCSIFAYIGKLFCKEQILKSLSRLEYRGYDSAGFALIDADTNNMFCLKSAGKVLQLKELSSSHDVDGYVGIGHTRWATHGQANTLNAHPHSNNDGSLVVVHNGIIENHYELKKELIEKGYTFITETDTEVMVHLLDDTIKRAGDLKQAMLCTVNRLKGFCTHVALHKDYSDTLMVVRQGSPLCIGVSDDGVYIASDYLAFADKAEQVYFVPDRSIAIVRSTEIEAYDYNGNALPVVLKKAQLQPSAYEKLDYEHYMLKEIYEQKAAIERTLAYYNQLGDDVWSQLGVTKEQVQSLRVLNLFGCGTSWHAARIGQFFFESIAQIPTAVHLASEFRYMPFFNLKNSLFIAISQSGETADTLELVRYFKGYEANVIALTNVQTSSLVRETDGSLLLKAGPEMAVASTKAFSTQLIGLYWLAHRFALERGAIDELGMRQAEHDISHAAQVLEETIERYQADIIEVAPYYAQFHRLMYLGRHVTYPFALEGALKLKEISYIFAQGYPAGELKHGSIALVDEYTPVILFSHQDQVIYHKLVNNAQEVKSRKGHLIVFAFEGQDELIQLANKAYIIPPVAPLLEPLAMTGLMQYFAYQVALVLGCDIDRPRNLAKAVTVE